MAHVAAVALGTILAAGAIYALCRHLSCAPLPAALGAIAWALSPTLLEPELARTAVRVPGPSALVPFALAGAFSRERRRWPFLVVGVVCAIARWRVPEGLAAETGALEALVLAVLAGLGAQRLWDGEGGAAFLIGAAAAAAVALRSESGAAERLVEAAPAAAALLLAAVLSRETRARAGLVALVGLVATQRALEIGIAAVRR